MPGLQNAPRGCICCTSRLNVGVLKKTDMEDLIAYIKTFK